MIKISENRIVGRRPNEERGGERLSVLCVVEGGLVDGKHGRCSACGGWGGGRVGRKTVGALLGGAKTSSLWGDSSATGVGDALYGGGKTGNVRGGVGGQRLVH